MSPLILVRVETSARKARYKNESFMAQPVGSVKWVKTMKTILTIEVKVDVARVITALTGLLLALIHIFQYF